MNNINKQSTSLRWLPIALLIFIIAFDIYDIGFNQMRFQMAFGAMLQSILGNTLLLLLVIVGLVRYLIYPPVHWLLGPKSSQQGVEPDRE